MNLVKFRSTDILHQSSTPVRIQYQDPIKLKPFSKVSLVNIDTKLVGWYELKRMEFLDIPLVIEVKDIKTTNPVGVLGLVTMDVQDNMDYEDYVTELLYKLNSIVPASGTLTWTNVFTTQLQGEITMKLTWTSTVVSYDIQLEFKTGINSINLGYPGAIINGDTSTPSNPLLSDSMTAPNKMKLYEAGPRNVTVELLSFSMASYDSISKFKEPIIFYVGVVDTQTVIKKSKAPGYVVPMFVYHQAPPNILPIDINNQHDLEITQLTVRLLHDKITRTADNTTWEITRQPIIIDDQLSVCLKFD